MPYTRSHQLGRRAIAAVASAALLSTGITAVTAPQAFAVEAEASTAAVAIRYAYTYPAGDITAAVFEVTATNLAPGATLTALIDGEPVGFHAGGLNIAPTATVNEDGTYTGRVVGMAPAVAGGVQHTVTLSDGTNTVSADEQLDPQITFGSTEAPEVENTAIGTTDLAIHILNLKPGSVITRVSAGDLNLLSDGVTHTVDDSGNLTIPGLSIPNDPALIGQELSVTAKVSGSETETTFDDTATISPASPLKNTDGFAVTSKELGPGLYQVAYSAKQNALFVTRSQFFGSENPTSIYKVNADTLDIEATYTPVTADGTTGTDATKVFGLAIDDSRDILWVTNTLNNSVSAYSAVSGELLKAFPEGSVTHPRAVAVDEATGRAYVSTPTSPEESIAVFDGTTLTQINSLATPGFSGAMELRFDSEAQVLYTVGFKNGKAARISLSDGATTVYDLPGDDTPRGGGVALDTKRNHLYVANQNPSTVNVIDLADGSVISTIVTGATPLDAIYDAVSDRVFVVNRGSGTATVINPETLEITGNLDVGFYPNDLATDGKGAIYGVNKPTSGNYGTADSIFKIEPITETPAPGSSTPAGSVAGSAAGSAVGVIAILGALAAVLGSLFHLITSATLPTEITNLIPWLKK
ncbi:YncE family protein [Corynebacterium sp. CCM 9185]|uniref:YncE family protein n=1 Tax=Corynebacterium marambiense TaxID=2765364 RepID=A0ABS0VVF5_9CORY|nr:YncE family protein [Corynebacterium marambiense]MBI9000779.1 YncE family protein [Corynebacterium marambiense]MCK7662955.1 YncE family protein [Corynebacterium marambiense]